MVVKLMRTVPSEVFYDDRLHVIWKDGAHTAYDFWELRTRCPCAECVDEFTGERLLDPNTVGKDIEIHNSAYIGNYGLEILWSDGHRHGIFTFKSLRDEMPHMTINAN